MNNNTYLHLKQFPLFSLLILIFYYPLSVYAQPKSVNIAYGDFDNWIEREIHESKLLGGNKLIIYDIAPNKQVKGNIPYKGNENSPWRTSNVMANIFGIVKASTTVYPERRGQGRCARLETKIETCKVLGIADIDVLVSGSILLGEIDEPIKNTSNPYSKILMGIPFNKRPQALAFDYKVKISELNHRIKSTGFSPPSEIAGRDSAEIFIFLQKRWEDKEGNVYAKRVGTGRERFTQSTASWVNNHKLNILYGNITTHPDYRSFMTLIPLNRPYYCKNSKGKIVPIQEIEWGNENDEVTHIMLMASAGCGTAYVGAIGNTLWIDNFQLIY